MYIPKTLQEENVHSNCLMGLIFSTSWRVAPKEKKIPYGDLNFLNFVYNSIEFSVGENFAKKSLTEDPILLHTKFKKSRFPYGFFFLVILNAYDNCFLCLI